MERHDQIRMAGNLVEQLEILGFTANEIHSIAQYMMAHARHLGKYQTASPESEGESEEVGEPKPGNYKRIKIQPN